jgi:hypothetical protein
VIDRQEPSIRSDETVHSTMIDAGAHVRSPETEPKRPAAAEIPGESKAEGAARLRVGVMLNDWTDRAWIGKIIDDIQTSDAAQVVAVILNRGDTPAPKRSFRERFSHLLYSVYHRLDRRLFRRLFKVRRDALGSVNLRPLLEDAEVLEVVPECRKFSDYFDSPSIEWVRNQKLDVILRFGFRIIRGAILESARYGVWSFHHGDNREYRGVPAMFWEMYEANPVCGVTLQILTDRLDGGKVIYRTSEKTNFFSLYLNQNRLYWKATAGVVLRLRQLQATGWPALCELDTYRENVEYAKEIYRDPQNFVMLRFLAGIAGRAVRRAWQDLVLEEQWIIAWRRPQNPPIMPATEGAPYRRLVPPRGYFYADPYPIKYQGRYYIFFEDYEYRSKRGVISYVELDSEGNATEPRLALAAECHLSYPCVFEHDGQAYMIPETRSRRRIELWRAERFPDRWTFDRVLMDGVSSVDTTWLHYQDRYWLFSGLTIDGTTASDELHVFWSTGPLGPWHAHRANPVVTTIRGARPAGRLFVHDGQLFRPGQDGAKVYGHKVHLYRVDVLNEAEYHETPVLTIEPEWLPGNVGTHTYHLDEDFELIDGRTHIVRGLRFKRRRLPT